MTAPAAKLSRGKGWLVFATVAFVTSLLLMLSDPAQVKDPFIRHDDFSALLGIPEMYVTKAFGEVRWVTFLWHLRDWLWPASVNYVIFIALWSIWCAAFAIRLLNDGPWVLTLIVAVLIASNPLSAQHILWFNSLIPGMAILAAHALLSLKAPPEWQLRFLVFAVFLSFLSYTTYPMLALLFCLADPRMRTHWNFKDAVVILLLSSAVALGLGLLLNFLISGEILPKLEDWRYMPKTGTASAQVWSDPVRYLVAEFQVYAIWSLCFLALLVWPLYRLVTGQTRRGVWLLGIHALGVVPLYLFAGLTGLRMTSFAYVFAPIALLGLLVLHLSVSRAGKAALAVLAVIGLVETGIYFRSFHPWQDVTRLLAADLAGSHTELFVFGDPRLLPSAQDAGLFVESDLPFRLLHLTSKFAWMCDFAAPCDITLPEDLNWRASDVEGVDIARRDGLVLLRFPSGD